MSLDGLGWDFGIEESDEQPQWGQEADTTEVNCTKLEHFCNSCTGKINMLTALVVELSLTSMNRLEPPR
jgi:hypothetical protein